MGSSVKATRRVTIGQVADRAGVSRTTVSHALSGQGRVDPRTRARIVEVAADLGYQPNRSAQNLRLGRTRTLALMLPSAASREGTEILLAADFFVEVANAAAHAAFAHDHALTLLPPSSSRQSLIAGTPDGAVVVDPVRDDPRLASLEARGIPAVTIERDPSRGEDPWWVAPDNAANARMALDHLAGPTGVPVALLSAEVDAGWVIENERAYGEWCRARGQEEFVVRASLENITASTNAAIAELLAAPVRPLGILTIAELFGPPALAAVLGAGCSVPDQIRLASGHDSSAARLSRPPLTAVDARPAAQAAGAVELLIRRLEGDEPGERLIAGELKVRASSSELG